MTAPLFTDSEKTRIAYFLNYPDLRQMAQSIQLGIPAASQPLFILIGQFERLGPGGVANARRVLCQCEDIECQLGDARKRMRAIRLGELETNQNETSQLRQELIFWTRRLADVLAVVPNPYSQIGYLGYGGGINAKVIG